MSDRVHIWEQELADDPEKQAILSDIKNGVHIIEPNSHLISVETDNYRSATHPDMRARVEQQILAEINESRYIVTDRKPTIVSALGAIPKPNSNKIRLIHDASRPDNYCVNSFAKNEKFQYETMDKAVASMSPSCYIAKVDLASAYRSVKLHPDCFEATGLKWTFDGKVTNMFDSRLPFGASRSPFVFNRLTQSVKRMMKRRGYRVICSMDDFLVIGLTYEECKEAQEVLISLLRNLGFHINWSKVQGPCQKLVFLGVEINTAGPFITLRLPNEKVDDLKLLLSDFKHKTRASKRQLQSLAGKLNWACQVIRGGRTFLRRIIDASNRLQRPHHKYKLPNSFFEDLQWWNRYLETFNGRTVAINDHIPILDEEIDASNHASGMFFRGDWQYTPLVSGLA